MVLSSWGRPAIRWTVTPDGHVDYAHQRPGDPPGVLSTQRADGAPPRHAWVAERLAAARVKAGRPLACTPTATDQPYGELSWGSGPQAPRLAFRFGCKEPVTQALVERLGTVTTQVARWAGAEEGKEP